MKVTADTLAEIAGVSPLRENLISVLEGLKTRDAGITTGQRFAHYIAQVIHESGRFFYDEEVWGPTPAQARYDIRTDLGNTAARDGDGFLYRGRAGIQITGKYNYRAFRDWCRAKVSSNAPDFVACPDRVTEDPWEGLAPIWYWDTHGLNLLADAGDVKAVTRRINGGYNGLTDRRQHFTRAALVLLGYAPQDVRGFQSDAGLVADNIPGPNTCAALNDALKGIKITYKDAPVSVGWLAALFQRFFS